MSKQMLTSHDYNVYEQKVYSVAHYLYVNKNYADAVYFFKLLVWIDPTVKNYWKGLGACYQALKHYKEALTSYQQCQQMGNDVYVFIHQADCHFALNQVQQALDVLHQAHLIAKETNNLQVVSHVLLMQDLWSQSKQLIEVE